MRPIAFWGIVSLAGSIWGLPAPAVGLDQYCGWIETQQGGTANTEQTQRMFLHDGYGNCDQGLYCCRTFSVHVGLHPMNFEGWAICVGPGLAAEMNRPCESRPGFLPNNNTTVTYNADAPPPPVQQPQPQGGGAPVHEEPGAAQNNHPPSSPGIRFEECVDLRCHFPGSVYNWNQGSCHQLDASFRDAVVALGAFALSENVDALALGSRSLANWIVQNNGHLGQSCASCLEQCRRDTLGP